MTKGSNLVIVESPSKAKTIGKYLGPDYRVEACMGHLRDLPKSKMGVDLEHDFEPDYQPLASKAAIISELRSASKAAKHIYLATDPDREGEAISWHLKELLELPDDKTERVTFNEITKNVVTRSIQEPRSIDYNLVDAQQARRILDRIVGYQLSPLLWKKIRRGLSAGRVQSVATRLVVEREQEIEAFVPKEYWTIDVLLRCLNKPGSFTAHYYGEEKKRELHSEAEADEVLRDIAGQEFTIAGIKRTEKRRSPTPPFITSTLQQEASRKLNMTPRRTMAVAQQLYEGVDISGEGTVGLITYMRTDSLRLSEEALAAARDFITDRYGPAYYPGQPRHFRKKEGAQDAHEAIRPSNVRLDPETIQADLTREQYRLYKLIWSRFVACQMSDARYDAVQIDAREMKDIPTDTSFLEMLDILNEQLIEEGNEPFVFDHDCREGICGMCSLYINGHPHGPNQGATTCQLYMRKFNDGDVITVEPWRSAAFPVIKDCMVDRTAFDKIMQAGGYVSVRTGQPQDANAILIPKEDADEAMDCATCIGCGCCVAACKNGSAMLFVSSKVSQLALLPQGRPEAAKRAKAMVAKMEELGFGNCTNTRACEAECPKNESIANIARLNREFIKAKLAD